jgi:hypothetical protein
MTGQVLASPQIEAKLARVEALYEKFHGVKLGRYKLYREVLAVSREVKAETGGYIQYDARTRHWVKLSGTRMPLLVLASGRSLSLTCVTLLVASVDAKLKLPNVYMGLF